jgi:ribosomal silencing factor RsfS
MSVAAMMYLIDCCLLLMSNMAATEIINLDIKSKLQSIKYNMAATDIINLDIKSKQQSIKYNMAATEIINLDIKSMSRLIMSVAAMLYLIDCCLVANISCTFRMKTSSMTYQNYTVMMEE